MKLEDFSPRAQALIDTFADQVKANEHPFASISDNDYNTFAHGETQDAFVELEQAEVGYFFREIENVIFYLNATGLAFVEELIESRGK